MKPENNAWRDRHSPSTLLPKLNQKKLISKSIHFCQTILQHLVESPELKVWQTWDEQGNVYWHGYDPVTQRAIYHVSESQIRTWIEQRYYQ